MTWEFGIGIDQPYWTFEYAISYILGPLLGGFMAGNIFNVAKRVIIMMETDGTYNDETKIIETNDETKGMVADGEESSESEKKM